MPRRACLLMGVFLIAFGLSAVAADSQRETQAVAPGNAAGSPDRARGNFPPLDVRAAQDGTGVHDAANRPVSLPGSGSSLPGSGGMMDTLVTTGCALSVVLALFGGLVWFNRRFGGASKQAGELPDDVLQSLGSSSVDGKLQVTFLKIGQRLLVVGQTPTGDPQTLTEIVDPDEVLRIENRCAGRPQIVGKRSPLSTASQPSDGDVAVMPRGRQASYPRPTSSAHPGYRDPSRRDLTAG